MDKSMYSLVNQSINEGSLFAFYSTVLVVCMRYEVGGNKQGVGRPSGIVGGGRSVAAS
jgi:hypothetical protein